MAEFDVLEPWLTESALDEKYWDDVAAAVLDRLGDNRSPASAREALVAALREAFPGSRLESDSGLFRDHLDKRLDFIVARALEDS